MRCNAKKLPPLFVILRVDGKMNACKRNECKRNFVCVCEGKREREFVLI